MSRLARTALRWLAWVAYPALAGAGFVVLALGVVTWLPALAAMADTLRAWRRDGEERCFLGVFVAFPRYLRTLLPHAVVSTVVTALLAVDIVFLLGRPEPVAFLLLCGVVGLGGVFVLYHLGLAVAAACCPEGGPDVWRRRALVLAFGSPRRTVAWLASVVAAPVLSLPVPFGPLLLGPSLPILVGLAFDGRHPSTPHRQNGRWRVGGS
ncbi:MAG TPA: hypothetical protein VI076_17705 [Actinopolymorphaceae bacterium]